MRHALLTMFAPLFIVATLAVMTAFPSPSDLVAAISPAEQEVIPTTAGGPHVETVILDLSGQSADNVASTATDNPDCFTGLALADKAKRERCAVVVYETLVDVGQYASLPQVREHLQASDRRKISEQITLAATEVCRIERTKKPVDDFPFDIPACTVAQVQLASDLP